MISSVGNALSRWTIVAIYGIGIFLRSIIIGMLNIAISVRLRHANSDKQLLLPFLPTDLALEKRNSHIGICLRNIKFDAECPLAYKKVKLSPCVSLVIQLQELENVWIGFSRNAENKVAIVVGCINVSYYLVTSQSEERFAFLETKPVLEEDPGKFDIEQQPIDEIISNTPPTPLVSKEVQQGIGKLLINLAQTVSIEVTKISATQQDSEQQKLNFTTHYLTYHHEPDAYIVRLENLIVEFSESKIEAHFTEKLSLRIGEKLQLLRLAFDQDDGYVAVNLSENALSELIDWSLKYQDKTKTEPSVKSRRRIVNADTPFRLEVAFSAQVIVTSLKENIFRLCLSDLQVCFDNIIDSNRVIARVGNFSIQIAENENTSKFFVGLIECYLTRDQVVVVLCEETTLLLNDLPLVHICKDLQLQYDGSDGLIILLDDEKPTHLKISGGATAINGLIEHLSSVMRDLLDTLLPNRLFIPGLAEARHDYHQRTDRPLFAEKESKKENIPQQTPMLFSVALAPETCCRVEMLLNNSQTLTSFSVLTVDITNLEACFFALPSNMTQFCERNLTSSWAIDIDNIILQDSVEGSHWRHAFRSSTPIEIRFIQKVTYLPTMQCEKKLGFYNNGEKIRLDAHLHEVFLRFMIDYYREIVAKDNSPKTGKKATPNDSLQWSLRFAPLILSISYKPSTSHGSLVHGRFLDTNVPNISLSNAAVNFKPYHSDCTYASFGAAMSDYFTSCFPQLESILLSASKALPLVQPIVQTATELASDLTNKNRTWKQTAARVTSNVVYGGTKLSVAAYKVARSTDRWLAKKQKSHLKVQQTSQDDDNEANVRLTIMDDYASEEEKKLQPEEKNCREENVSIYANQPRTVKRALSDGAAILQENAEIAFSALVTEPKRAFKHGTWQNGAIAALYGLPRAITRSATGLTGATVKLGHGLSNAIDEEKYHQRHNKWKSESYTK